MTSTLVVWTTGWTGFFRLTAVVIKISLSNAAPFFSRSQVCALKHALSLALNEQSEQFRTPAGSRVNVLPSKVGDMEKDLQEDNGNTGGVGDDPIATSAAVAAAQDEQQPIQYHRQGTTIPGCLPGVSTFQRHDSCHGFQAERSARGSARAINVERSGGITIIANQDGQTVNSNTDVRCNMAVVHGGSGGTREVGEHRTAAGATTVGADWPWPSGEGGQELQQHAQLGPTERRSAEPSPQTAEDEMCNLGQDLAEARATAVTATECRRVAEARVVELEEVIAESERQHALFRARGESRLEALKMAFAQEQEEEGAQVRPLTVFSRKNGNQPRILGKMK